MTPYDWDSRTTILESSGEGSDSVALYLPAAYVLPEREEYLASHGEDCTDATGNDLDNRLIGNTRANHLVGLAGNDTIRGGGGSDWLEGGDGDNFLDAGSGDGRVFTGAGQDTLHVSRMIVEGHRAVDDFDIAQDRMQVRGFCDYTLS
jgi:Ca2+-binding RTX toxin-like protein